MLSDPKTAVRKAAESLTNFRVEYVALLETHFTLGPHQPKIKKPAHLAILDLSAGGHA